VVLETRIAIFKLERVEVKAACTEIRLVSYRNAMTAVQSLVSFSLVQGFAAILCVYIEVRAMLFLIHYTSDSRGKTCFISCWSPRIAHTTR
jgi:hypothetical protein